MTTAQDLALSVSLASYARPETAPEGTILSVQRLVQVDRPKKGRAITAKAPTAKPVEAAPKSEPQATNPSPNGKVPVVALPAAGTLGAKAFIMMMNRAKDRQEKICAIAGYCGWDGRLDYGQQESAALSKAKAEIRPIDASGPTREERRQAARSATGYVAGMPNALKRTVLDLLGREQFAVDTRESHLRDSKDEKLSAAERELALGLAQLEEERLVQIRADLAKYVG